MYIFATYFSNSRQLDSFSPQRISLFPLCFRYKVFNNNNNRTNCNNICIYLFTCAYMYLLRLILKSCFGSARNGSGGGDSGWGLQALCQSQKENQRKEKEEWLLELSVAVAQLVAQWLVVDERRRDQSMYSIHLYILSQTELLVS